MKCFMTNQDCIFEGTIQASKQRQRQKKDLFVISPFGYPYDDIYQQVILKIADAAEIRPQRADRAFQLGFVMCRKICRLIQEADYILADVTENNPNVYYELGLSWGFGKKIILLCDTQRGTNGAQNGFWVKQAKHLVSYDDLMKLKPDDAGGTESFKELLNRGIDVEMTYKMDSVRKPSSYINHKEIAFCYRKGGADARFYKQEIFEAARQTYEFEKGQWREGAQHGHAPQSKEPEKWEIVACPLESNQITDLPNLASGCKVWIVDMTHYGGKADPMMYFVLGLAHALGRETVPITNKALGGDPFPFDVRGLWQIYFNKLETLREELANICKVIAISYFQERQEYPLRFFWDRLLEPQAHLKVFTCARGLPWDDKNRPGGRTNVDKWDYTSVAELTFFLAQKYKHARVRIEQPEEKDTINGADAKENQLEEKVMDTLQKTSDNVIIIGSPDVSDYAEVILAKAYNINPYQQYTCKQKKKKNRWKCWECDMETDCIGKRSYLYYKNTVSTEHPRHRSTFFREPPSGVKECVVWYGERFECEHSAEGKDNATGHTFGVLTILKDRNCLFGKTRWIIVLSGYTGVATFGLAQLLTADDQFYKKLTEPNTNIDLEKTGAQVLIRVDYWSDAHAQLHDSRHYDGYKIIRISPFRSNGIMNSGLNVENRLQKHHTAKGTGKCASGR